MRRHSLPVSLILLALFSLEPPSFFSSQGHSSPLSSRLASATLLNVTVDDTSSSIAYSPSVSWRASSVQCSICLEPDSSLAFQQTWHEGTHIIPTSDGDDDDTPGGQAAQNANNNAQTSGGPPLPSPTPTKGPDDGDGGGDDNGQGGDPDSQRGKGGGGKRDSSAVEERWNQLGRVVRLPRQQNDSNPFFVEGNDNDDPGFVDHPVTAQLNFTGSAIYVFAIVPLFPATGNNTPTFMNLSYTFDSQPAGNFNHAASPTVVQSPLAYQSSAPVFVREGLAEGFHSLTINVGPDSTLLLDYILYSQDDAFSQGGNGTENAVTSSGSQTHTAPGGSPSGTSGKNGGRNDGSSSHSVATFAGAVGGSVGLLALLSLSLAISIYRRRLRSKRRDNRERAARASRNNGSANSFHTEASEDAPAMSGPAPFVPRYFPGTVPTAPPPYAPSPSMGQSSTTPLYLLSASPAQTPSASIAWPTHRYGYSLVPPGDTSYADRPPPTPPLDPEDYGYFASPSPPPFGVAISTPTPAILAGLSSPPSPSNSSEDESDGVPQTSSVAPNTPSRIPSRPPSFDLSGPLSRQPSRSSVAAARNGSPLQRSDSRAQSLIVPYTDHPSRPPSVAVPEEQRALMDASEESDQVQNDTQSLRTMGGDVESGR